MRTWRGLGVAVALSLLAACSGGGDGGSDEAAGRTPTTEAGRTRCVQASPSEDDLGDLGGELRRDGDVDRRVLDNGLTVYVRENDSPGGRGSLSLVVRAGSVLEPREQQGTAHFLEHMLFNGTERFPGNELVQELERFGSAIGPDLNAYTSYDETVYLLELPDVSRRTRQLAVDVLAEWAARATIDEGEVEDERGVVNAERRQSTERGDGRAGQIIEEFLLEGTPYEGASTIGTEESIQSMTREPLVDFYETWYQPQNMAVVAVGDFDVDDMHDLIEDGLGDLGSDDAEEHPDLTAEPWDEPRYLAVIEPELSAAFASIGYTIATPDLTTGSGQRAVVLPQVVMEMVATRLSDGIARGDVPLTEASSSIAYPVAGLLGPTIDISGTSADLAEGMEDVVAEMERACRFGFSEDELERALDERRSAVEQEHENLDSKQDGHWAADYRNDYLTGELALDGEHAFELHEAILDSISLDDVNAWWAQTYAAMPPSILAAATAENDLPDEDGLAELAARGADLDLEAAEDVDIEGLELLDPPEPVEPEDVRSIDDFDPYPVRVLEYANGLRVIVQSSDIAKGSVLLQAASPGGLSVVADDDVAAAMVLAGQLSGDVLTQSGVGDLDQVTLDRLLADQSVEISFTIEPEEDTIIGSATAEDAETLLQLTHLYLTEPRVTEAALRTALGALRPVVEAPESSPELLQYAELFAARFPDEPRYALLPDADALDDLTAAQLQAVAEDRFVRGGDFVVTLVGDLELDELEELASTYLGTLPGRDAEQFRDVMSDPPSAPVVRTVRGGTGDQGGVTILFETEEPLDATTNDLVAVLTAVVETRLREVIREELGATYSPSIQAEATDLPRPFAYMIVQVSGDPDDVEALSAAITAELAALARGQVTGDELDRAIETVATDFELWNNGLLAETHLAYARHPSWDYRDFLSRPLTVRDIGRTQVIDLASRLFGSGRYVEVRMLPGG